MKNLTTNCFRAAALGAMLALPSLASAQSTTIQSSTSSTTSAGTISDFSPDAMTVRTVSSSTPSNYTFTKTTTYVDENGNPVSVDVVKSGMPVTVYYTQDGDRMVASKVVVRKTTTTTDAPAPAVIEQRKSSTTTTTSSTSGN
ncbi:MAG TPA: hypothetical protein VGC39_02400 [Candidatus Methylacidiphilales bacterium]